MTNARKHARAKLTQVILDFRAVGKTCLSVIDDGVGAGAEPAPGGFGLLGLRERAQLLGGVMRAESTPNAGLTLTWRCRMKRIRVLLADDQRPVSATGCAPCSRCSQILKSAAKPPMARTRCDRHRNFNRTSC